MNLTSSRRLHLILSHEREALQACLAMRGIQDPVLLADDGVLLLEQPGSLSDVPAGALYALKADVQARAVAHDESITVIDDPGLIALIREHEQVLSWR